jgi:hypothetical protein
MDAEITGTRKKGLHQKKLKYPKGYWDEEIKNKRKK